MMCGWRLFDNFYMSVYITT